MFKWILKMRQKSEGERRRSAFLITSAFTLLVIIVWLSVLFSSFGENGGTITVEDAESPLESLTSSVSASFRSLKGIF